MALKVTIHQPEHFPYMGFFQKVQLAELFVVLDNVNYRKNYFQNRNKIKNLNGDDEWITVPVEKKATSKNINEVQTSSESHWKVKILKKIKNNLNYDASFIYCHKKLIDINMASINWAMSKLHMDQKIIFASSLNVSGQKSELLANILKKVGATEYISGPSGRDYLDMSFFKNIEVTFFEPKVENHYSCLYNLV